MDARESYAEMAAVQPGCGLCQQPYGAADAGVCDVWCVMYLFAFVCVCVCVWCVCVCLCVCVCVVCMCQLQCSFLAHYHWLLITIG